MKKNVKLSNFTKGMNEDEINKFLRVHKEYSQVQKDINDLQKKYNKNLKEASFYREKLESANEEESKEYQQNLDRITEELKTQENLLNKQKTRLASFNKGKSQNEINEFVKINKIFSQAQSSQDKFNNKLKEATGYWNELISAREKGKKAGLFASTETGRLFLDNRTAKQKESGKQLKQPKALKGVDYSSIKSSIDTLYNWNSKNNVGFDYAKTNEAVQKANKEAVKETVAEAKKLDNVWKSNNKELKQNSWFYQGMLEDEKAAAIEVSKYNKELQAQNRYREQAAKYGDKLDEEIKEKILNEQEYNELVKNTLQAQSKAKSLGLQIDEDKDSKSFGYVKRLSDATIAEREGKIAISGSVDVNKVVTPGALATESTLSNIYKILSSKFGESKNNKNSDNTQKESSNNKNGENNSYTAPDEKEYAERILKGIKQQTGWRNQSKDQAKIDKHQNALDEWLDKASKNKYLELVDGVYKLKDAASEAIPVVENLNEELSQEDEKKLIQQQIKAVEEQKQDIERMVQEREEILEKYNLRLGKIKVKDLKPQLSDIKKRFDEANAELISKGLFEFSPEDVFGNRKSLLSDFEELENQSKVKEEFEDVREEIVKTGNSTDELRNKLLNLVKTQGNIDSKDIVSTLGLNEDLVNSEFLDLTFGKNATEEQIIDRFIKLYQDLNVASDNSSKERTSDEKQVQEAITDTINKSKELFDILTGGDRIEKYNKLSNILGRGPYREDLLLNEGAVSRLINNPKGGYIDASTAEEDEAFAQAKITREQLVEQLNNIGKAAIKGYSKNVTGKGTHWTRFKLGDASTKYDENGVIYKVYGSFEQITDLNDKVIKEIMELLQKVGFNGRLKTDKQADTIAKTDQLVIHGASREDQIKAYQVLKYYSEMQKSLSFIGTGFDYEDPKTKKVKSFSELLEHVSVTGDNGFVNNIVNKLEEEFLANFEKYSIDYIEKHGLSKGKPSESKDVENKLKEVQKEAEKTSDEIINTALDNSRAELSNYIKSNKVDDIKKNPNELLSKYDAYINAGGTEEGFKEISKAKSSLPNFIKELRKVEVQAEKTSDAVKDVNAEVNNSNKSDTSSNKGKSKSKAKNISKNEKDELEKRFKEYAKNGNFDYDENSLSINGQGIIKFTRTVKELGDYAEKTTYKVDDLNKVIDENNAISLEKLNSGGFYSGNKKGSKVKANISEEQNLLMRQEFEKYAANSGFYYDKKSLKVSSDGIITFNKLIQDAEENTISVKYKIENLYDTITEGKLDSSKFDVLGTSSSNTITTALNKQVNALEKILNIKAAINRTDDELEKTKLEAKLKAQQEIYKNLVAESSELLNNEQRRELISNNPRIVNAKAQLPLAKQEKSLNKINEFKDKLNNLVNSDYAERLSSILPALYDSATEKRIEEAQKDLFELFDLFKKKPPNTSFGWFFVISDTYFAAC